ncbi:MAG: hypothetical protein RBR99_03115 [Dehalococcoidales bacterium]|jgi:hypothetical protein|nr:hypothetical protein [Dehalococcoidales bacterium]MDX9986435.1 hypothetical protein [Dehalococcoidales bacterium]
MVESLENMDYKSHSTMTTGEDANDEKISELFSFDKKLMILILKMNLISLQK